MHLNSHLRTGLTVNTNNDSISAYRINTITGALTEVAGSPFFAAGSEPISVTIAQPMNRTLTTLVPTASPTKRE
jgi:hypothetical protein